MTIRKVGGYGATLGANTFTGSQTLADSALLKWSDVALARNSSGTLEVNSGTASAWRDIKLGNLLGVGYVQAGQGTAITAGGSLTGLKISSATNFGVFVGSGAPTISAAQGSLYLRSDGSSTSTRAYINTDGGTTWTAITTAA
jgi:hypothetical protein